MFKIGVVGEFYRKYGVRLRVIGKQIGPGTLDEILDRQYAEAHGNVHLATAYVHDVLRHRFSIDVQDVARRSRLGLN